MNNLGRVIFAALCALTQTFYLPFRSIYFPFGFVNAKGNIVEGIKLKSGVK
jgi:hypothetical protein